MTVNITCPECGGVRTVTKEHFAHIAGAVKCVKCTKKAITRNKKIKTITLNGCTLIRAKNGVRCTNYRTCENAYTCLDKTSRLDWQGWETK